MADITQNIILDAAGGDSSANEIKKTSDALGNVTTASNRMQETFSHRFSHIGLQIFAGDLLRAEGLGSETKQIIGVLQTAIMGAGAAFGEAAGPIMLVVAGFSAVVAIADKVSASSKDLTQQYLKIQESGKKQIQSTDDIITSLKNLKDAVGTLTPAYDKLLKAEEALRAEQIKGQETTNQSLLLSLNQRIAKEQDVQDTLKQTVALETQHVKALSALKPEMEGYTMLEREVSHLNESQKELQKATLDLTTDQAKLNLTEQEQIALHKGVVGGFQAMTTAANNYKTNVDAMYRDMMAHRAAESAEELKQSDNQIKTFISEKQQEVKENQKALDKEAKAVDETVKQISGSFGNAFAQMIVEGQSFTQSMEQAFTQMAEQIIAKIVEMIAEWAIFTAISGLGGPVGAFGAMGLKSMGGFTSGGSIMVSQPTTFTAGENGPEEINISPAGYGGNDRTSGGGGTGGGTVNIYLNVDHIDGADPASTLQMLSDEIRRESAAGRQFATTVAGVAGRYPNQAY